MISHFDYFTIAEYRDQTGDNTSPYEASDSDIVLAQREVVRTLEKWAKSAWPNVVVQATTSVAATGTTLVASTPVFAGEDVGAVIRVVAAGTAAADLVTTISAVTDASTVTLADAVVTSVTDADVYFDGIGHAAQARSFLQKQYMRNPLMILRHTPILGLLSLAVSDNPVTSYQLDEAAGTVRWGDWSTNRMPELNGRAGAKVEAEFTFGATECPIEIKRPAIEAAQKLAKTEQFRSRIPRNVTSYRTEGTTFVMDAATREMAPWPWDDNASTDVRTYWMPSRSQTRMVVA